MYKGNKKQSDLFRDCGPYRLLIQFFMFYALSSLYIAQKSLIQWVVPVSFSLPPATLHTTTSARPDKPEALIIFLTVCNSD